MKHRLLLLGYLFITIGCVIYSYTQVDLNLTLSGNSIYQSVQTYLTQIGYFYRPISSTIFLFLMGLLSLVYIYCLGQLRQGKFDIKTIKWLIGITTILLFAYPAFSHDIFNYMFDARIVTRYGLDPHFFKALDFPFDPWIRFMRWTHRYYPYGPGWLWLTFIPSYLGMGKFVLTLGLFKLMFLVFHLGNIWLVGKLADGARRWEAIVFYALNPLVLIESLVSPHNEVMMLFFSLFAIYLLVKKNTIHAIVSIIVSISIKYISIVLLPLFWFIKPIDKHFYTVAYWLWITALVPVVIQREPYSWYAIPLVGLAALSDVKQIKIFTLSISIALLVRYFPFLWWGEYTPKTQDWQMWGFLLVFAISGIVSYKLWLKSRA